MKRFINGTLMRCCATLLLLELTAVSYAACPGWSSASANIIQIQVSSGGNYNIQIDATNAAAVDVCSCRLSGQTGLWLYKPENPATDATKAMLALAMWAKALNKPIFYGTSGCYNGQTGSGYSLFYGINPAP